MRRFIFLLSLVIFFLIARNSDAITPAANYWCLWANSTNIKAIVMTPNKVVKTDSNGVPMSCVFLQDVQYLTPTGSGANLTGITPSQIGLGNLTNDAQVKKASSSTDGYLPKWSGTAGNAIVDGYHVGMGAYSVPLLDGNGYLPALDGRNLINLPSTGGSGSGLPSPPGDNSYILGRTTDNTNAAWKNSLNVSAVILDSVLSGSESGTAGRLQYRSTDNNLVFGTGSGFSQVAINPMTTTGDIVVAGANGVPNRLAKGSAGYQLTVNASTGAIDWEAPGSSSMTWPSTAGIVVYGGSSAWGSSITNSAGLLAVISDAVGTGKLLFQTNPKTITGLSLASGSGSGNTISGSGLTVGSAYYQGASGLALAKADSAVTIPALGIADTTGTLIYSGVFKFSATQSWTVGGAIYLSDTTAGALTQTPTTTSTHYRQKIGVALAADTILIMPSIDYFGVQ